MKKEIVLGVDVGGTGIKGALVDVKKGVLTAPRFRIETPEAATPLAVAAEISKIARHFRWKGIVGCTLPSVVRHGVVYTAANIDKSWIGTNAEELLKKKLKTSVVAFNDADAAGIAEMEFGAGRGKRGLVAMITLGTGIGSALFFDGMLIPNSEIGHLELRGKDAERRASNRAREERNLSWKKWGKRVNEYLSQVEALLWPELFIIGGGVSKEFAKFKSSIKLRTPCVPAKLLNEAGIIGAALHASRVFEGK